jgi:hypothetical protein
MNLSTIRGLFAIAALYDGVLGLLFLVAPNWIFTQTDITPPNHPGYVQFSAALLIIFGLMFLNIARDPGKHAPLILYGMLLKVAYCGVAFTYWISADIPWIWKPFAIIDLVMLALFAWAWNSLNAESRRISS